MSTYLQLVNNAIKHSGIDLDELTSVTFASPSDSMHEKMKEFVDQAWREIQLERNEWEFQTAQYQGLIYPRFLVVEGDRSVAPPADSVFEGDDTEASFTVISTSLIDGAWADGDAVAWINYSTLTATPKFNEQFDETSPTIANTNVFRLKWWGRYDLITDIGDCLEPNLDSFYIQSTGGSSTQDNTASSDNEKLKYVPWSHFNMEMEWDTQSRGKPRYFTTTPDGHFDFWPRPDEQYVLTLQYTKGPQTLSAHGDTPTGLPAAYHDMIFWRAIMAYAEYDQKGDTFRAAERRHNFFKTRLERNEMPVLSFGPNRYYR